jgi:hypothetical protein
MLVHQDDDDGQELEHELEVIIILSYVQHRSHTDRRRDLVQGVRSPAGNRVKIAVYPCGSYFLRHPGEMTRYTISSRGRAGEHRI